MNSALKFYRPELDGLRLFAFLAVLFSHTLPTDVAAYHNKAWALPFTRLVHGGAFGVDLFFCLSAYLITELLLREKQGFGTVDVKSFYIRRALRIWPLYLLVLSLGILATRLDPSQVISGATMTSFLFFVANWYSSFHGLPHSFIDPLWSISLEEQFYLAWPWAVRLGSRQGMAGIALTMIVISNVARVLFIQHGFVEQTLWLNSLTRLDPMAFGILIAVFDSSKVRANIRGALQAIGVFLWILAALGLNESRGSISPVFCYPAAAVGVGLVLCGSMDSRWLRWKPLVELGKRSYGLYVFHAFGFYLGMKLIPIRQTIWAFTVFRLVAIALTLAFALSSYKYFEMPFLRLKQRFTKIQSRDSNEVAAVAAATTN